MTVTLTDQDFAKLKALTAEVVRIFGDNWPLEYDTGEDEVVCRYEDEDAPFTDVFITLFRTSQWMPGEKTSPLAEFLAVSPKVVPALMAEVERLRDNEAKIRAEERARCVAELRIYSKALMPAAADQVIAGDETNGFAAIRFASSMARASQLLESGELSTPSADQGEAETRG
jgi:hypothetical protein